MPSVPLRFMELYLRTKFSPNNEAFWAMPRCRYELCNAIPLTMILSQPKVWLSLLFVPSMPRQEGLAASITKFQENIRTLLHVTAISVPVAEDRTRQSRGSPQRWSRGAKILAKCLTLVLALQSRGKARKAPS